MVDGVPLFRPHIGEEEVKGVVETLHSGWLTTGPKTKLFEDTFANYLGAKYAVGVSNCTTALFMSILAGKYPKDSEIITTPLTFCASANAIEHAGHKTVLADVERDTGCIDPQRVREKITDKTKAIIPVHFGGHPCDMDELTKIAEEHGLDIIEDAAHAIGTQYKGKTVGTIGRFTCFSFYANKNLVTGQGGMITVDNKEDYSYLRKLRMYGFQEGAEDRYHEEKIRHYMVEFPGYNFRLFDLLAAVGLPQLTKLDEDNSQREEIKKHYDEAFSNQPHIELFQTRSYTDKHGLHLYSILVDIDNLSTDRDGFLNELRANNVGTGIHYDAVHYHPFYKETYGFKKGDFPNAEYISDRTISLPFFPGMTEEETNYVISTVKNTIEKFK